MSKFAVDDSPVAVQHGCCPIATPTEAIPSSPLPCRYPLPELHCPLWTLLLAILIEYQGERSEFLLLSLELNTLMTKYSKRFKMLFVVPRRPFTYSNVGYSSNTL